MCFPLTYVVSVKYRLPTLFSHRLRPPVYEGFEVLGSYCYRIQQVSFGGTLSLPTEIQNIFCRVLSSSACFLIPELYSEKRVAEFINGPWSSVGMLWASQVQ